MTSCQRCQAAVAHVEPLTPREAEVLTMLAKGMTTKQTARLLGVAPHTVNEHIKAVYKKLGVDSRAEAGAMAARLGLA